MVERDFLSFMKDASECTCSSISDAKKSDFCVWVVCQEIKEFVDLGFIFRCWCGLLSGQCIKCLDYGKVNCSAVIQEEAYDFLYLRCLFFI